MKGYSGFGTCEGVARVVDITSLDGVDASFKDLAIGPPIHPAYLQQLPDWKVNRADPATDPAQTTPIEP